MPRTARFKTSRGSKPCSPFSIKRMTHRFKLNSYHQHKSDLGKAPNTKTETVGRCIKACNTEPSYQKHLSDILPVLFSSTNNMTLSTTNISNMHHSDAQPSFFHGFTLSLFIQSDFTISPFHHFVVTWFPHFAISPLSSHHFTILSFCGFPLLLLLRGFVVVSLDPHIIYNIDKEIPIYPASMFKNPNDLVMSLNITPE